MIELKQQLLNELINHVDQELVTLLEAANAAHAASTDEQSVAETQYDTLAIEAGYLAEGQSNRVSALTQEKLALESLLEQTACRGHVRLGSLAQLANDEDNNAWFYLAPACAGYRTTIDGHEITVITPESPMGAALVGKAIDDEVELHLANQKITDELIAIG